MSAEQVEIFVNTESRFCMAGALQTFSSAPRVLDRLVEAFRSGAGMGWHEHDDDTFIGVSRHGVGRDYHAPSLELARSRAAEAGVGDRVAFQSASASELSGTYDFITFFDCLHDMPDPVGALRAARPALSRDGRVMLVEPMSSDSVADVLRLPRDHHVRLDGKGYSVHLSASPTPSAPISRRSRCGVSVVSTGV
jgi:SAM-dependent methyltransferase